MAYRKRAKSRSNSTKTLLTERDGKKSASSRSHHKKKLTTDVNQIKARLPLGL